MDKVRVLSAYTFTQFYIKQVASIFVANVFPVSSHFETIWSTLLLLLDFQIYNLTM